MVTPVVSHPTGDAMVQTWRMRTLEPLAGQNVLIDGLQNTMTDALVRVEFANGNTWTARLTPGEPSALIPASQSAWAVFATYVRHGIEHIAFGFDHLLFVAGLMLIVRDWRKLVKAVTAFTVAHSITLTCATTWLGDAAVSAGRGDDRHQHRHGRGGSRANGARAAQPCHHQAMDSGFRLWPAAWLRLRRRACRARSAAGRHSAGVAGLQYRRRTWATGLHRRCC